MLFYYEKGRRSYALFGSSGGHSPAGGAGDCGGNETGGSGSCVWGVAGRDREMDVAVSAGRPESAACPAAGSPQRARTPERVTGGSNRSDDHRPHAGSGQACLCPVDPGGGCRSGAAAIRCAGIAYAGRAVAEALGLHAAEAGSPSLGTEPSQSGVLAEGALSKGAPGSQGRRG